MGKMDFSPRRGSTQLYDFDNHSQQTIRTYSSSNAITLLLKQQDYGLWLDPQVQSPVLLQDLLSPYPSEDMKSYEVSSFVNNPKHNSHQCIEAVA